MIRARNYIQRTPFVTKPRVVGSRRWLIAELDYATSRKVRERDKVCVTCGSRVRLECSHFYSRRYLATRFDLTNCNAMCHECNMRHNFNPFPYARYMQSKYGEDGLANLNAKRMALIKVTDEELRELLAEYRERQ
jgi:5-methylcytosine-specific restriction endonuclease McrA